MQSLKVNICPVKSTGDQSLDVSREAPGSQGMRLYLAQRDVSGGLPTLDWHPSHNRTTHGTALRSGQLSLSGSVWYVTGQLQLSGLKVFEGREVVRSAEVLPELAAAVPTSPPFREARKRMHQRSIWLGPKGTQTPLHCDPYHNLLCQVVCPLCPALP